MSRLPEMPGFASRTADSATAGTRVPRGLVSPDETLLLAAGPSKRYYLARAVVGSVMLVAVSGVAPALVTGRALFLLLGLALGGLWWLPNLTRSFYVYVLTDQRLIERDGVLATRTRFTPLTRVQDVTVRQGLLQRMLGCGDLELSSAGAGRDDMVWTCIDRPFEMADAIRRQIEHPGVAATRPHGPVGGL